MSNYRQMARRGCIHGHIAAPSLVTCMSTLNRFTVYATFLWVTTSDVLGPALSDTLILSWGCSALLPHLPLSPAACDSPDYACSINLWWSCCSWAVCWSSLPEGHWPVSWLCCFFVLMFWNLFVQKFSFALNLQCGFCRLWLFLTQRSTEKILSFLNVRRQTLLSQLSQLITFSSFDIHFLTSCCEWHTFFDIFYLNLI